MSGDTRALRPAQVGRRAPPFELPWTGPGGVVRLDDFDGRWLVLFFYPQDFSLLCPLEVTHLHDRHDDLARAGASVVGVSTDSLDRHREWIAAPREAGGLGGRLAFGLASDVGGEVCRRYGVLPDNQTQALRGLFLVDPNGVLQFLSIHSLTVGRSADDILRTLEALKTGGMCPPAWEPGEESIDLAQSLSPGRRLAGFEIQERIGKGGMGSVWRAVDVQLQRPVAIKVLDRQALPTPEGRARFLREARTAAAVSHRNICAVHQVEEMGSELFLVLELIEGSDLADLLAAGPLPAPRAASIGRQIASGLGAIHARGLIHRDVKPRNIRVEPSGRAVLLDFGLARCDGGAESDTTRTEPLTQEGMVVGTIRYMSPEQVESRPLGAPTDVFSLGVTLYETLTARTPFDAGDPSRTLLRILSHEPDPPAAHRPDVPVGFSELVMAMIAKDAPARPNATAVERALAALAE